MGLYDKNGDFNDNHWVLKAARWAGSHYKVARRILLLLILIIVGVLILIIVGVLLCGITYN